jgi:ferrous iron transport protein B
MPTSANPVHPPPSAPALGKTVTVALLGNPNTGKSTLFTALAGVRQRVGNYPGVTVEKKVGRMQLDGQSLALVDLPGTYSLAPRSLDEMVTVDVLLGRRADVDPVDVVLCIVDASNLERNLYLVSQVLELGLPTIIALNMIDIAEQRGVKIAAPWLAKRLGVPVVEVQANRGVGVAPLKKQLAEAIIAPPREPNSPLPEAVQNEVEQLEARLRGANGMVHGTPHDNPSGLERSNGANGGAHAAWPRYLVERLLLDTSGYLEHANLPGVDAAMHTELAAARTRLADAGMPVPAIEAVARYEWIGRMLDGGLSKPRSRALTASDKLDRFLTNKFWGTLVFALLMLAVFSSIFIAAQPVMDLIDSGRSWLQDTVQNAMPAGALSSLVTKGIIFGAGSVVDFLPQILILFLFISVLEDCGYMARAAYLMDRLMVRVGLSGKSFIPLLSSFACAIPGVMATRVIENRRDRLTTILVAPLMSCSARLPVYTLLIGAFVPQRKYLGGLLRLQGLTLFAMYLVGIVTAVFVAWILKRTLLRGATPPFVMELPPYKIPSIKIVVHRMLERGWQFIARAGTIILAVAVVVWALLYYPHNPEVVERDLQQQQQVLQRDLAAMPPAPASAAATEAAPSDRREFLEQELARWTKPEEREKLEAGAYQRHSILGHMGRFVEPVVRPLGWDWRLGCAAIASFPAREVVLGTLGVIYNLGEDVKVDDVEGRTQLQTQLHNATWDGTQRPVFTVPVALSVMVFFALCAQCAATLAVIKRETNSWRWPAFTFTYMTVLAYLGALATYQIGTWLGG